MTSPPDDLDRLKAEYHDRAVRLASSDKYSLFNIANLFLYHQRQREILNLLRSHRFRFNDKRILEVGCGGGGVLLELLSFGASPECLHGMDLLKDRIKASHQRLPHLSLVQADGQILPYANHSFDLILQFTVFSSILSEEIKFNLATEMLRSLKPGGMILWYDFWLNPTNKQTRGIQRRQIQQLFPNCEYVFRRITLAPPISRRIVPYSWWLAYLFEKLAIFNTHYLAAIRPVGD